MPLIAGGQENFKEVDTTDMFNLATGAWREGPKLPQALKRPGFVQHHGSLYLFGGGTLLPLITFVKLFPTSFFVSARSSPYTSFRDLHYFDAEAESWETRKDFLSSPAQHSSPAFIVDRFMCDSFETQAQNPK